jgi:hypothetical protein
MPGPILNANAMFSCPHQAGQFKLIPKNMTVLVGGAPVLTVGDIPGSPMVPCPAPPKGTPSPVYMCEMLVQVTPGSTKVLVKGQPVLTASSIGTTTGVPPTPAMPKPSQTKVIATS